MASTPGALERAKPAQVLDLTELESERDSGAEGEAAAGGEPAKKQRTA